MFDKRFVQSIMDKNNQKKIIIPYLQTLIFFQKQLAGKTCLMGLGAGSAVPHLRNNMHQLFIVEIMPDMIEIAEKFFYFHPDELIQLHCSCANQFITKTTESFQHIIIDLGDNLGFPSSCRGKDFFEAVYQRLEVGGILALNLTTLHEVPYFTQTLKEVFRQQPLIIEQQGNWLLFTIKDIHSDYLIEVMRNHHYLKSLVWYPQYGMVGTIEKHFIQSYKLFLTKMKKALQALII